MVEEISKIGGENMFAKVEITGTIELVTGMHIGDSAAFSAIGAVDSPIIKDARTKLPMIPGSSLKGKMRTLLAKRYNEQVAKNPSEDCQRICRLFGASQSNGKKVIPTRLLFTDMILENREELLKRGAESLTEVKFENTIDRVTAVANPRQIERAIRGSEFPLTIIYEMTEEGEMIEDFETLSEGFKLLKYDYIGGSGSRGYGKIKVKELYADVVIGEVSDETLEKCQQLLEEVK